MDGSQQLATKAWLFRDPLGWFTDVGMLMGTPEQLTFIGRDGKTHFEADRSSLEVKWLKREGNGALWVRTGGRVYRLRFARHEYDDDFDPNTGDEGIGDLVEDLAGITDWRAMLGRGRDSVRAWKAFLAE
jgi:hypothetical protein